MMSPRDQTTGRIYIRLAGMLHEGNRSGLAANLLAAVGLRHAEIERVVPLHQGRGHRLLDLTTAGSERFVLKVFEDDEASEVRAYRLLSELGVPTLPVCAATPNALLLEHLESSAAWRLATEDDMVREDVGAALAGWYRALHDAGARYLAQAGERPAFLRRESDELSGEAVRSAGVCLNIADLPAWQLAAERVEILKAALQALPETITYNDFHWTNLALSRTSSVRAVVFDYDLLGVGPAVSDYRNVLSVLRSRARDGFQQTYGAIDERQLAIDVPLATIHALVLAARLPRQPAWAASLKEDIERGTFEAQLRRALECL